MARRFLMYWKNSSSKWDDSGIHLNSSVILLMLFFHHLRMPNVSHSNPWKHAKSKLKYGIHFLSCWEMKNSPIVTHNVYRFLKYWGNICVSQDILFLGFKYYYFHPGLVGTNNILMKLLQILSSIYWLIKQTSVCTNQVLCLKNSMVGFQFTFMLKQITIFFNLGILEAQKCIFNLVFSHLKSRTLFSETSIAEAIFVRLSVDNPSSIPHEVILFDLKILFLLTALCSNCR